MRCFESVSKATATRRLGSVMSSNAVSYLVDRHVGEGRTGRVAIRYAGGQLTYGELAAAVNQAAHHLLQLGVRPEQRVALLLRDGPEFVYFFMAALKIGAVAVPLNTFCNADQLAYYLNDTRAPLLVTERAFADKIPAAGGSVAPLLAHVILAEDGEWRDNAGVVDAFPVAGDDSAFWLYTSGSTGPQKGVVHRHESMRICAENYARDVLEIGEHDVCYSTSKLFFAYGLGNSITFPFAVGASCVLNGGRSDADTIVALIKQCKPTLFFSVPTLYEQLLNSSDVNRELFAGVRMCVSAGEYLPEVIFDAWRERTGKIAYDGIGSTEAMHIFCSNRPGAYRKGASGRPVEGYELKIVDDHGNPVAPTEIGRLLIRGKTIAKGYWNKYDASQSTFQGEWLATGDIYQQTDDGYFKYIGRQGDAFKSSGLWVSPAEIEQALLSHPDVREAGVVAMKNSTGRFVARAFVALKEGAGGRDDSDMKKEIHAHLKGRLSRYKLPESVEILSVLPKTATGKIARAELRQMQCGEPESTVNTTP